MYIQLLLMFLMFVLSYYIFRPDMHVHDKRIPIVPWNLPWVGHLFLALYHKNELLDWILNLARYYDRPFYLSLPTTIEGLILVSPDPSTANYVLNQNFSNYIIPSIRKKIGTLVLGNGIFQVDGELWKVQRELAKPMFKTNVRKGMVEVFVKEAIHCATILQQAHKDHMTLDIQELFKKLTLDTFGEIGLGTKLGALQKTEEPFCTDFDWVENEMEERFFNDIRPHMWFQYKKHINQMNHYVFEIIEKRKKEGFIGKTDILSLLLQTKQENKMIRDFLMNFFVAGRDTTAALLSWTFYYFSKFPQVEAKVAKEIDSIFGTNYPTFEGCKELKYLRMVLDEVLRLHPSALPLSGKQAIVDDVLPNGSKVKGGQMVLFFPYIIHRLEKYWGEDSETFVPERWEEFPLKKDPYIFIPFQRGPRTCLGMDMAYEEAKTVITVLIQSGIRMRLVPGQNITYKKGVPIIFSAKNGMFMKIGREG